MMFDAKVVKIGDDLGTVFPADCKIPVGADVVVEFDDSEEVMKWTKDFIERYRGDLEDLADS